MGPRVIFSAGFWDAVPSGLGLGETALAWVKNSIGGGCKIHRFGDRHVKHSLVHCIGKSADQ